MRLKDFDYHLSKRFIAQHPVNPRDQSRLLVLDKKMGKIAHRHFFDIVDYLKAGDVLVLNNTKVMRARLIGKKVETGGKIEVFLLKKDENVPLLNKEGIKGRFVSETKPPLNLPLGKGEIEGVWSNGNTPPLPAQGGSAAGGNPSLSGGRKEVWQCLAGGKGRKEGLKINFARGLKAEILKNNGDGTWNVKFNQSGREFMKIVERIGQVPLPPYIKRERDSVGLRQLADSLQNDKGSYQTVYAAKSKLGSVAAPTAGFHFTKTLIHRLKNKGVQFELVTLRVGLGTFAPVKADDIVKHKMHAEWIEAKAGVIRRILKAKQEDRRVIAVGTTSVRTLEHVFGKIPNPDNQFPIKFQIPNPKVNAGKNKTLRVTRYAPRDYAGWTKIFIYPGYKFKAVDGLITNFHLPKSTPLMLVSALVSRQEILAAYRSAIRKKYRFYSYGDAMLII